MQLTDEREEQAIGLLERTICGHVRNEGSELTMRQVAVLIMVSRTAGNVCDIAKRLNVAPAVVSRAVDSLCKSSLAVKRRSLDDRRGVLVSATAQGQSMLGRLMASSLAA